MYVRCHSRYAVLALTDSNSSEHKTIIEDIVLMLSRGFKFIVLDFKGVTKINSHIIALALGTLKATWQEDGRLFISNMPSYGLAVLEMSVAVEPCPQELDLFSELGKDSIRELSRKVKE